jgi:hypothetical protein
MSDQQSHVVMQAGGVRIDSDPAVLASLIHNLAYNKEFRTSFERDPATFLADCGVDVPENVRTRITPENITAALREAGAGEASVAFAIPGVGVAIRVGTRPGTRPGVSVGVRVATGTSVFAVSDPRRFDEMPFEEALRTSELSE